MWSAIHPTRMRIIGTQLVTSRHYVAESVQTSVSDTTISANSRSATLGAGPNGKAKRLVHYELAALIIYAFVSGVRRARVRAFWFDELCTFTVAQQHTVSRMWDVLRHAADSHPLPFYLVERSSAALVGNLHIAYRLPSILAFCCTLLCVFVFAQRLSNPRYALLCTLVPMLTILYTRFAIEGRGYAPETAAVAVAMVCYQKADRWLWTFCMGLSLAAASSFHYYSVFVLPAFALAELAHSWKVRRWRWAVWAAFSCVAITPLVSRSALASLKIYYGAHYWVKPTVNSLADSYGRVFNLSPVWGMALVAALSLGVLDSFWVQGRDRSAANLDPRFHERVLVLGMLCIPIFVLIAMKLVHGAVLERYILPIVLGIATALACILPRLQPRAAMLIGVFLFLGLLGQESTYSLPERYLMSPDTTPARQIEDLVDSAGHEDLPIVVSNGQSYFELLYYDPSERSQRFVTLVDPKAAMNYADSDFLDKNMLALKAYAPLRLRLEAVQTFTPSHPEFLLYSDGGLWDWWPTRFLHDGYGLELLATRGSCRVYLVRTPTTPSGSHYLYRSPS
jgi:hypothetical protein